MKAWRFYTTVDKQGRLRLPRLRLPKEADVEVLVLQPDVGEDGLMKAAESGLSFWDNRVDAEIWNRAWAAGVARLASKPCHPS